MTSKKINHIHSLEQDTDKYTHEIKNPFLDFIWLNARSLSPKTFFRLNLERIKKNVDGKK